VAAPPNWQGDPLLTGSRVPASNDGADYTAHWDVPAAKLTARTSNRQPPGPTPGHIVAKAAQMTMTSSSRPDLPVAPDELINSAQHGYPQLPSQVFVLPPPNGVSAVTPDELTYERAQWALPSNTGVRDLAYASALVRASECMLDASDANSLWPVMASEAATVIAADAVAVVRHTEPTAGLVVASAVGIHPDVPCWVTAIEAATRHGWLWEPRCIDDLSLDREWSAAELPVGSPDWRSLLVVPLDCRPVRGVTRLVWFSEQVAAFDRCVDAAHLFGRHASAAVRNVVARETLNQAIAARHRVGQAQGVLMARYQLTAEQAFAVLKRQSQATNVKLRIIADQVIRSGALDQHRTTPRREHG
jgi:ANTAR domain